MGNTGRVYRAGLALASTCLLVGSIFWLALPARAVATISITPSSGPPGTSVTIAGAGFGANEDVVLCWGNVGCRNLGLERTTSSGEFTGGYSVPTDPEDFMPGVNTVAACGRSSRVCAQVEFSVIAPATTIATTTTAPETITTTTIADAPTTTRATTTTTRATTTTMARTTTTRQTPTTTGETTTPTFGSPTSTQPDQSDPVLLIPTTTLPPNLFPTLTPLVPASEVLSLILIPSDPSEPTDEGAAATPLTTARDETAPLIAASEGNEDGRGLDQTEAILLWLATMGVAAGGLFAYEFRKR